MSAHKGDCPGGCAGTGLRYASEKHWEEERAESCTGKPYRFRIRALRYDNFDVSHQYTVLLTDDESEADKWRNIAREDPDGEFWVEDREYVPPPPKKEQVDPDGVPF